MSAETPERLVFMWNLWWKLHPKAVVHQDHINGLAVPVGENLLTVVDGQQPKPLTMDQKGGQTMVCTVGSYHIEISAPHPIDASLASSIFEAVTKVTGKLPEILGTTPPAKEQT